MIIPRILADAISLKYIGITFEYNSPTEIPAMNLATYNIKTESANPNRIHCIAPGIVATSNVSFRPYLSYSGFVLIKDIISEFICLMQSQTYPS